MNRSFLIIVFCFFLLGLLGRQALAQDELMDLLAENDTTNGIRYTTATFKSTRLINGHSVETRPAKVLEFVISHRFGRLNSGLSELYGLDQAFVRFALEYGVTDRFNVGLGRSSFDKSLDSFVKYKFLRQSTAFPLTVTGFGSVAVDLRTYPGNSPQQDFVNRLDYTAQLLLARKISSDLSLQLMPSFVHRNLAPGRESNNILALGMGGRYKFTPRMAIEVEYYQQMGELPQGLKNSLGVAWEIETGGHVFQLIFSNAVQMIEKGFLAETTGDFFEGDIHFGFNISRVFNLAGN